MIAQSQSGTGKTAAFVLAMLSRVNPSEPHPQVLCLSPTFDLAKQTGSVLEKMAHFSPEIKMAYALKEHKGRESAVVLGCGLIRVGGEGCGLIRVDGEGVWFNKGGW